MSTELAKPDWELPPLTAADCGPFGDFPRMTNEEKAALWTSAQESFISAKTAARSIQNAASAQRLPEAPPRVPVTLGTNNRIFLLDPRFGVVSADYGRIFEDAEAMLVAQLRWEYVRRQRHHVFCDEPAGLPARWQVGPDFHNVYEAAFFGAAVEFPRGEVPATRPILPDDRKNAVFDLDIDRPLSAGFLRHTVEISERMMARARGRAFLGRPIDVRPYVASGSDGPLTVAMNIRGPALLVDLRRDPDYVRRLFAFIVAAAVRRRAASFQYWNIPEPDEVWLADDSIAMLGVADYRRHVLPHHRAWYEAVDPDCTRTRCIHLCGDATRHFPTLHDELGVTVFDTGFPVDFAELRRSLGPGVKILGGVEVTQLRAAAPTEVYTRAREILESGVTAGPFVLREANNLPPGVPWPNLAAMYKAAFDAT